MTDRSEVVAIRDALDAVLKLPDAVLAIIAGLLPPPRPAQGNDLDQDPPDRDSPPQPKAAPAKAKPAAPKGKPSPEEVAARENELIEAIRGHPSARTGQLGACLLNPGEMGFEPLKPVGEPDAANSRIRFDVRVEALRPSFVAPFPRWRSSAGCECGKGRGPPLGELQDIVGEADEAPLVGDLLDAAQEKLTEAARLLDLSEHRLGQLLS